MKRFFTLAVVVALGDGCGRYVPALFADCAVVTRAGDDAPIPVPTRRSYDEREQLSEIYLRRPLFDVVHPSDFPVAGDVNAMDEVPPSSWFDPHHVELDDATPPQFPLKVSDESPVIDEDALVVHDARGHRYELIGDPPGQPGLYTGAEVLGGRLLRSLGLHAPMAFVVDVSDEALGYGDRARGWRSRFPGAQVSATRWPSGIDVGCPSDYSVRRDDPNDTVDHSDRRTLRALRTFAQWIGWNDFGVRHTRDVYVGKPDRGHLVHYVVGTAGAFGTREVRVGSARDELGGGFWWNLGTLGLSPPTVLPPQPAPFPSIGFLPSTVNPGDFSVSPPYSPFVRFGPADEYWAAKRLLDAGDSALVDGLVAAHYPTNAANALGAALRSRRRILVEHAMTVVTPLDVAATIGRSVWLRDRAISAEVAKAETTVYQIELLDGDGAVLSKWRQKSGGALVAIALPQELAGRVVLHIRSVRGGVAAPRWCDVHVTADATSARLIGVRH